MDAGKDHYGVLGVTSNATYRDIKVAFRQLARKYHPDVNKHVGADEMFKTIRLAYEILSKRTSRDAYDHFLRLQAEAGRKKIYENHQSGYKRERKVTAAFHSQQSRGPYWRAIDHGDLWEFSSAGCFRGGDANAYSRNFGSNMAGRTCKDSGQEGVFGTWVKCTGLAWVEGWEQSILEVLAIFCLVAFIWHTFGAQLALTYFVFFMPRNKQHTAWYTFASVVAWLIGGKMGLALQYCIATMGWLYGRAYDNILAFVLAAIWIGGYSMQAIPLPRGGILLIAYACLAMLFNL